MIYFAKSQDIRATNEPSTPERTSPDPTLRSAPRSHKRRFKRPLILFIKFFVVIFVLRFGALKFYHKHIAHTHPFDRKSGQRYTQHSRLRCGAMAQWSDPEDVWDHDNKERLFSSDASFTLPRSSESLLFLSDGAYASGDIEFAEDDMDNLNPSQIRVDINVRYSSSESLQQAEVCSLDRWVGNGIAFFTPNKKHRARRLDELKFQVSVRFPRTSGNEPSVVNNLETSLPMFEHYFPRTNILFKTLGIKGGNVPIHAESLMIGSGEVETKNSPVTGNFTVFDTLEISTSHSEITANVAMYNTDIDVSTHLIIQSFHSPIQLNITLISTSPNSTGGQFIVDAHTSTSPLDVRFTDAPADSVLQFTGTTSVAAAYTELHHTFEGKYNVGSSLLGQQVVSTPHDLVTDPRGQERSRSEIGYGSGKDVSGLICWTDGFDRCVDRKGFVKLFTSMLGAHLVLR